MLAGTAITAGGMYWFSRIGVHTTYLGGLLGPMLVTAAGLGLLFVPLSLVVLTRVRDQDSGLASSLLNTGQQVGGAIGLAALGTVAWTTVADSIRSQVATAAAAASRSGHHALAKPGSPLPASIYHNALAAGITRGFLAASGIALAAFVIAAIAIRVRREDLAGPPPRQPRRSQSAPSPRWSRPARDGRARGEASRTPPMPREDLSMNTQNHVSVTRVQIHADHAVEKWLGNWTAARTFQVRAGHAQVTIDLRSPQIPAGDIELDLRRRRPPDPPGRAGPSRRGPGSKRPDRPAVGDRLARIPHRRPPRPRPGHRTHPAPKGESE